jgi:hypothetical protein
LSGSVEGVLGDGDQSIGVTLGPRAVFPVR